MCVISLEKEGFTDPKNTNEELININCKDSFSFQKGKSHIIFAFEKPAEQC